MKKFLSSSKDNLLKIGELSWNTLAFISSPGIYNERMQRQMGVMIYDTMNYESLGIEDLEQFILENVNISNYNIASRPIINIHINKKCAGQIFSKLELMGINGGLLFLSEEGVAMDIINTCHYLPRLNLNDIRK